MPISPLTKYRLGLDTEEGGMMSPFTVSGGVSGAASNFDSNIFSYGKLGGSYSGAGGGSAETGGLFDPGYQARLDQEALLYFQQQEAAKQARLDQENRLAEEERLAQEAAIAEQARLDALAGKGTDPVVTLPPVIVGPGGYIDQVNQNIYNLGLIGPANDPANLGVNPNYKNPNNTATASSDVVTIPPVIVTPEPTGIFDTPIVSAPTAGPVVLPPVVVTPEQTVGPTAGPVTLPPIVVTPGPTVGPTAGPITLPPVVVTPGATTIFDPRTVAPTDDIVTLPPFTVTPGPTITPPIVTLPPVTVTNFSPNVTYTPFPTSPVVTTTAPASTTLVTQAPFDPNSINSGVGNYGTNAQTLTTKRDFGAELSETLAALQKNQSGIMGMYGNLYNQFMPKGITESESGIIGQYKADLNRLQQRQAGVLSPEDVRQSQQAAREAYGARGQVMGRGAVGAEILGRENIRQQREDQARAGLQSSYGNVLNMANLQTGNIFSPIGNLMSNTFNPLSPYAADVYGTNVNAQLAKEIAQKNYDAAVRSAELQGAAAKSASNTSLFGDLLKFGGTVKIAMACMPGYQAIDTPNGPVPIQDLRGGDYVIGYDNTVKRIEQLCSYVENPETEFLQFTLADGGSITVCGPHKILDIPAREWLVGSEMNGVPIVSITKVTGVTTSYDLMTDVGGYRIAGIPVNSMIPEMIAQTIEQLLLNRS